MEWSYRTLIQVISKFRKIHEKFNETHQFCNMYQGMVKLIKLKKWESNLISYTEHYWNVLFSLEKQFGSQLPKQEKAQ